MVCIITHNVNQKVSKTTLICVLAITQHRYKKDYTSASMHSERPPLTQCEIPKQRKTSVSLPPA